jgi:hypothetical protein
MQSTSKPSTASPQAQDRAAIAAGDTAIEQRLRAELREAVARSEGASS